MANYNLSSLINLEIFVPYRCTNNCPYCISKDFYERKNYNFKNFINKLKKLNKLQIISYYKLTGGEPIDNFEYFKQIVDNSERQISIYTSLPLKDNLLDIIMFINDNNKIIKVVISYHNHEDFLSKINYIQRIKKYIQINKVVNEDTTNEELDLFFNDIKYLNNVDFINIRYDFTQNNDVNNSNLVFDYLNNNFDKEVSDCSKCNLYSQNICRKHIFNINEDLQIEYNIINNFNNTNNFSNKIILKPDSTLSYSIIQDDENFENDLLNNNFENPYIIKTSDNKFVNYYHGYIYFDENTYTEINTQIELDYITNYLNSHNIENYELLEQIPNK